MRIWLMFMWVNFKHVAFENVEVNFEYLDKIAYSFDEHLFKVSKKDTTSIYLGFVLLSLLFLLNFGEKLFHTLNIFNVDKETVFCLS